METLQNILSQQIIQRLGWTLINFVWQGAVVAILTAVVLKLFQKASSNLRYITTCSALAVIVILPVATFQMIEADKPVATPVIAGSQSDTVNIVQQTVAVPMAEDAGQQDIALPVKPLKERFVKAVEPILPYAVLGWLIGVFVLSIWYLGGWTQLQRLQRQMVEPVSSDIREKLNHLSQILGISKAINIFQSALVSVPTVIGHLKPVILLPASVLTGLSGEQIEAVLAHELAHIKRCDYLVNILQTVVEILGFYHPAVWWISNKIRTERENCCDDIAVSISENKICYAEALATMEEIRFGELAVAAGGGNLFERIKRLLGRTDAHNERAGWLPSVIAVLLLIALAAPVGLTFGGHEKEKPDISVMNAKINKIDIDNATREDVIKVFGEPDKYMWGDEKTGTVQVLDKDNLPGRYVMFYPDNFRVFMVNERIIEFRFEGPSDYVFGDGLAVGSSIEKAFSVLGEPSEALDGQPNKFQDNVFYKNIDGKKGYGYYAVPNKNIRIWIMDDKVGAIYVTRSGHSASGGRKMEKAELPNTSYIDKNGHIVDKIDYPFVNDPQALGGWEAVDFVRDINDFMPGQKSWGGDLFLKELFFLDGGKTNWAFTWTKGLVLHSGDKTASKYIIREMNGSKYMFMEWKSGDYTFRHMKPSYYVLRLNKDAVYVESRTVDKIDYPFVDDPKVLGRWESVDFVDEIEDFKPDKMRGKQVVTEMLFEKDGTVISKMDKIPKGFLKSDKDPNGYLETWTKGLVIHNDAVKTTASRYTIKKIDDSTYMFLEWKSGDYTIRHMKPKYYVLKKAENDKPEDTQENPIKKPNKDAKGQVEYFKQRLEEPVTVHIDKSPDGSRLTIQYAAIAICNAAGVPYNWNKSAELAEPQRRQYIDPVNIEDEIASQAIADLLGPVGLLYGVDANGVYLYNPEKTADIQGNQSNLEILGVNFEPIRQWRNILWLTVKNTTDKDQFLKVHIYTRSVDYGPQGVGWGTGYYEKIDAGQIRKLRYVYKIQGPITKNTYVRLSLSNAKSLIHEENRDIKPFVEKQYSTEDLKIYSADNVQFAAASSEQLKAVSQALAEIQKYIRGGDYEKAWNLFSSDYQKAEYQGKGLESFRLQMEPKHPLNSAFLWGKQDFLKLKPVGAYINEGKVVLTASADTTEWKIDFVQQDSQWKIDWIIGYRPKILDMQ